MSDRHQAQDENLNVVADAPPTQPRQEERPKWQEVQDEAAVLSFGAYDQDIRELYAHFGAECVEDLAETDWSEFIRLTKLICQQGAGVLSKLGEAAPPVTVKPDGSSSIITMRDKAVALAKMGLRVLPVKPGTKEPAQSPNKSWPPKGQYHQHIPSSDPADVAAMWTGPHGQSLTFDLGINTEGHLVLDIDDRDCRTGIASFASLASDHGLDLDTPIASTPSDGRHYFYKLPPGIDPSTVKSGSDKLGSGIDQELQWLCRRCWHGASRQGRIQMGPIAGRY
jgi:Bifunctional DNA primase/polymerase, N-terminal